MIKSEQSHHVLNGYGNSIGSSITLAGGGSNMATLNNGAGDDGGLGKYTENWPWFNWQHVDF